MSLARTGLVVVLFLVPARAGAQDAHGSPPQPVTVAEEGRKGFVIGLGGGVGQIRTTLPSFGSGSFTVGGGTDSTIGVATDFKIGYAPADRVLVYYTNSVVFADSGRYDLLALTGGGVTVMGGPRAPTWFVSGSAGVGTGSVLDFSGSSSGADFGSAFSVGGGVEFARRWFLEGSVMVLTIESRRHTVLKGTINWIFY